MKITMPLARAILAGVLAAVWIAVPIFIYAYLAGSSEEVRLSAGQTVWAPVQRESGAIPRDVGVLMSWAPSSPVFAPAWSGLVQRVAVHEGDQLRSGTAVATVSGVVRTAFVMQLPISRPLHVGDSGPEVQAMNLLLNDAGFTTHLGDSFTRASARSVGLFAKSIGASTTSDLTEFDPGWVLFLDRPGLVGKDLVITSPALVGVLGPSGSGKSSLLGVIGGAIRIAPGVVTLSYSTGESARIDWIVQSSPLLTRRSAIENVMLGPLSGGASFEEAEAASVAALSDLGMESLANQRAATLSGGERQRVSVARAIAARAPLLLADEPTASLDPLARGAVCDALAMARERGSVVLVATHDPFVAEKCDVTLTIENCRLLKA